MARRCTTEEFFIESENDRIIRRKTIQERCLYVVGKANNLPISIDIRQLNGNLFLSEDLPKYAEEGLEAQKNPQKLLYLLRIQFKRSRSFFENFNQKGKLLMRILVNLLENIQKKISEAQKNYKHSRNLYKPWVEAIDENEVRIDLNKDALMEGTFDQINSDDSEEEIQENTKKLSDDLKLYEIKEEAYNKTPIKAKEDKNIEDDEDPLSKPSSQSKYLNNS